MFIVAGKNPRIRHDRLTLNLSSGMLYYWGTAVHLTARQRELLLLVAVLPMTRTKRDFYNIYVGEDPDGGPLDVAKLIDVYMKQLRDKLFLIGVFIETQYRMGFRLIEPDGPPQWSRRGTTAGFRDKSAHLYRGREVPTPDELASALAPSD